MRARYVVIALVASASPAAAQATLGEPIYPNIPPAPVNLDPGAGSDFTGPVIPPPQPQQPAQPNVIVVGPDGKVTSQIGSGSAAPTGYYVGGGDNVGFGDQNPVHDGPVPELHTVRTGDTLWDICWYYFNDPWQWPKVWSYNPQITNPHWIYPGDLVRLLPRGVFATAPSPTPTTTKPPENLPAPQNKLEIGLKQTAFVEQGDIDKAIIIDGAVDEKELLGDGDSVYLTYPSDHPPVVGQRYSIYEVGDPVRRVHPEYGKPDAFGAYVHILGELEVVSVKQDKRARAVITAANQEIERGQKVGALVKTFKTVPPKPAAVDAQANIIAMITRDALIGQGELIMLDIGKGSGVEVGNRMFVVRRGDAVPNNMQLSIHQDDRRFPARALGEVVIVEVGDTTSVGLVTLAVQEMSIGDMAMMQKSGGN